MDYAECKRRAENIHSYIDEIIHLQKRILTIQDTQIKNMDMKARSDLFNNISQLEEMDFYRSNIDDRARLIYDVSGQLENMSTEDIIREYGKFTSDSSMNRVISYLSSILEEYYQSLHDNGHLNDILGKKRDDLHIKLDRLEIQIQNLSSFTFEHNGPARQVNSLNFLKEETNSRDGYRIYYLKEAHNAVNEIESIIDQRYKIQFHHGDNFFKEIHEHRDSFIHFVFIFN